MEGSFGMNTAPKQKPPSFGFGKLLVAILLAILFFLLAQSMVRHRFFRGGQVQQID
jgi:hypothetical protein